MACPRRLHRLARTGVRSNRYRQDVKKLVLLAIALFAVTKYTERGRRARKVYIEEVSSGSKPIEAVGTAVAAFVGLAPGVPVNTP